MGELLVRGAVGTVQDATAEHGTAKRRATAAGG